MVPVAEVGKPISAEEVGRLHDEDKRVAVEVVGGELVLREVRGPSVLVERCWPASTPRRGVLEVIAGMTGGRG